MSIKVHCFPDVLERSSHFRVLANGLSVDVLHHSVADHAQFECEGFVDVVIELSQDVPDVVIRPLREEYSMKIQGSRVVFTLHGPRNVTIANCGLHNGDDNIAIKALARSRVKECCVDGARWDAGVAHVHVLHCMFYNCAGGSAMEIGFETSRI